MTIYILWLRQMKRYLRSKSRIIGSLGQPLLYLVGLGFGFGPIFQKAGGGDYIQFLSPGIISMSILFTAIFSGIEIIWDKQFGFLKETLVAPVPRWKIMIGRTLGGGTIATIQGIIVLLISLLAGFSPVSWAQVPLAIICMLLVSLLFTAFGTALASILDDFEGFQLIMSFLVMPMFFLSGSLFPIATLPKILKSIIYINPLSYGVDGIRGILTGTSYFTIPLDFAVLIIVTALLIMIGSYLFSKIEA